MISINENIGGNQVTLSQIETGCRTFEERSAELESLISDLEADLAEVKQKHLAKLKRQAKSVANAQADLHSLIERAPGLFIKPRTITIHGVKVGFTGTKGTLEFDDEATVIALIKKVFKADAEIYIRKTEAVDKNALRTLTEAELAKIGCRIDGAGDVVILKRTAGDVEKLLNKLIAKMVETMVEGEEVRV